MSCQISTASCTFIFVSETTCPFTMLYNESDWCVSGCGCFRSSVKIRSLSSRSGSRFRCLLRPLPLQGENNTDRLVPNGDLFMVGRYALQSPGLFSPVWYRPTSALRTDPRTPQQLCLCDGRRVNHWGDPAWHQVECATYLVDASWCNEHNGDGKLQRNMASFSLDSVAVESNHLLVLPSWTGVLAWWEWWNSILV